MDRSNYWYRKALLVDMDKLFGEVLIQLLYLGEKEATQESSLDLAKVI